MKIHSGMTEDPNYQKVVTLEIKRFGDEYIRLIDERSRTNALQPSPKKFFICPVGVVGSGKTTVLTMMEHELSYVRISGDEIRELLHAHHADPGITWQVGAYTADHYVHKGLSIAHDTDCATSATRDNIVKVASSGGYRVFWLHVIAPQQFILNKLRNHKPSYLFRNSDEAVERYRTRMLLHQNLPEIDFLATIDTSQPDLETQVAHAVRLIKNSLGG